MTWSSSLLPGVRGCWVQGQGLVSTSPLPQIFMTTILILRQACLVPPSSAHLEEAPPCGL